MNQREFADHKLGQTFDERIAQACSTVERLRARQALSARRRFSAEY